MTDKLALQANFDSLNAQQKREFTKELVRNRAHRESALGDSSVRAIDEGYYNFALDPNILGLRAQHADLAAGGRRTNPYFQVNESIARGTTIIAGRQYVNFANYNYLGLSGESLLNDRHYVESSLFRGRFRRERAMIDPPIDALSQPPLFHQSLSRTFATKDG